MVSWVPLVSPRCNVPRMLTIAVAGQLNRTFAPVPVDQVLGKRTPMGVSRLMLLTIRKPPRTADRERWSGAAIAQHVQDGECDRGGDSRGHRRGGNGEHFRCDRYRWGRCRLSPEVTRNQWWGLRNCPPAYIVATVRFSSATSHS